MKLTLGLKLAAVIGPLALAAAGLAAFSISEMSAEQARSERIERSWRFALEARVLAQAVEHVAAKSAALYASDETARPEEAFAPLRASLAEVVTAERAFLDSAPEQTPEMTQLDLRIQEFLAYQTDTVSLGTTVSSRAALIQATDEATIANREHMVARITQLGTAAVQQLDAARDAAADARLQVRWGLAGTAGLAISLALALAFWFALHQIERPLRRLRATMQDLARGRLDTPVPVMSRQDEIGEMAEALGVFQNALREKARVDAVVHAQSGAELERAASAGKDAM